MDSMSQVSRSPPAGFKMLSANGCNSLSRSASKKSSTTSVEPSIDAATSQSVTRPGDDGDGEGQFEGVSDELPLTISLADDPRIVSIIESNRLPPPNSTMLVALVLLESVVLTVLVVFTALVKSVFKNDIGLSRSKVSSLADSTRSRLHPTKAPPSTDTGCCCCCCSTRSHDCHVTNPDDLEVLPAAGRGWGRPSSRRRARNSDWETSTPGREAPWGSVSTAEKRDQVLQTQ